MVRLAEALGDKWGELNEALAVDRCLRGRLFGVLGSSLALGDHLVANPQAWHLLQGNVRLPSAEQLRALFAECVAEPPTATGSVVWGLRALYRNRSARAGRDGSGPDRRERAGAGIRESGRAPGRPGRRCTGSCVVGRRGHGLRRPDTAAAGDHRDGQMRCTRTELRQRRRRDLRSRVGRSGVRADRGRDDAAGLGCLFPGGCRTASGGSPRRTGPHLGLACRLLPAVGQDLGVSGAAEGATGCRRRRTGQAVHRHADADGVERLRA